MNRRPLSPLLSVLAAFALVFASCSDGETDTDPTPAGIGDDDSNATVPRDDDGAIGEPDDEDSQTDTTESVEDRGDVVPSSDRARVVGSVGDRDIELVLTEETDCAIRNTADAGDEAGAQVSGTATDGAEFELSWSVDAGQVEASLSLDGTAWTVRQDLDGTDDRIIHLTRDGEVLLDTTFETDDGQSTEAVLFVSCQPSEPSQP